MFIVFYKAMAGVGVLALVAIAGVLGWQAWQGAKVAPVEFCSVNDDLCHLRRELGR
jgi:predicted negative regulator of RcsB-dependent stress response